jgi:hypothetical protein
MEEKVEAKVVQEIYLCQKNIFSLKNDFTHGQPLNKLNK